MPLDQDFKDKLMMRTVGQTCRKLLIQGTPRSNMCKISCSEKEIIDEEGDEATALQVMVSNPISPEEYLMLEDTSDVYYTVEKLSKFW